MKKAALFLLALCTLTGIPQAFAQQAATTSNPVQNAAFKYLFTIDPHAGKDKLSTVETIGMQQPGIIFCRMTFNKHAAQTYFRLNANTAVSLINVQAWLQSSGIAVTHFFNANSDEARQFLNAHP